MPNSELIGCINALTRPDISLVSFELNTDMIEDTIPKLWTGEQYHGASDKKGKYS